MRDGRHTEEPRRPTDVANAPRREELIIGRRAELPKRWHEDCLHSLLVQGCLAESWLLSTVRGESRKLASVAAINLVLVCPERHSVLC